tara:strand:- start:572 stop:1810 length:1239 start_codon:yes stop_codon:yes gene_type:complete
MKKISKSVLLNIRREELISKNDNICVQLINLVPYNKARVLGLIKYGFKCKCLLNYKTDLFKPLSISNDNLDTKVISKGNRIYKTYEIIHYIISNNFNVVFVTGYLELSSLSTIVGTLLKGNKIILFSESQEIDLNNRNLFKEIYKRIILKVFDGAVVGGECHKKYLMKLGMRENIIFKGYDCVDNNFFTLNSKKENCKNNEEIYVCCVCRFVEKKNLFTLIKSFRNFKKNLAISNETKLKIAGSGPLENELKFYVKSLKIKDIEFVGPINYNDLPKFYAKSKGLILLSTSEQWGLVTNEALNCGIPVLISEKCGSRELIKENINGFIVNENNQLEISSRIKDLIQLADRKGTKLKCRNSIRDISTINFAKACYEASNASNKIRIKKITGFIFILILLFIKNLRFTDSQKFEA